MRTKYNYYVVVLFSFVGLKEKGILFSNQFEQIFDLTITSIYDY